MRVLDVRLRNILFGLVTAFLVLGMPGLHTSPALAQFSPTYEFLKALKAGDYRGVKSNIMGGANVNAKDDDGTPALVLATDMGDPSMVKFLLDQGAHVDEISARTGETSLMRASAAGDHSSAGVLLYYKANINAQDRHGETPLMKAIRSGHRDVVKLLVDAGANLDLQDYTGNAAIDYAQNGRQRGIEKILVDAAKKMR